MISVSWPNVLWFMIHLPHPQRPSGRGRAVSQDAGGRHWVGGVRTGFLCLLFNGPTQRAEHTQLPADCTLWEESALFVEEVGSILAVRPLAVPLPPCRQPAGIAHTLAFQPPMACFGGSALGKLFLDLSSQSVPVGNG